MLSGRGILRVGGVALALSLALPSVAEAGRKYRVLINSDPSAADVYVNDEESDPVGTTPFKVRLEAGSYTLIFKKEGYQTVYQQIRVQRRGRKKFKYSLEPQEAATLEIKAPEDLGDRLDGADVIIDGENVGSLPLSHEVSAGAHSVEVEKEGFEPFAEYIEVDGGQTKSIVANLAPIGGENKDPFSKGAEKTGGETKKSATPRATGPAPMVVLGAGLELGGRVFRYEGDQDCDLCRTYDAHAVPRFRIQAEIYPLVLLNSPLLDGLGITGSFGRAAPLTSQTSDAMNVNTTWFDFDVGMRYQYPVSPESTVGAGIGYGREEFTFDTTSSLFAEVPVVDYRFVRLSVDGRMRFHEYVSGFAGGQLMLVSDVGELGTRFEDNKAYGFGARAGGIGHIIEGFDARVEGLYNQFAHSYTPSPEYNASGGKDHYWAVMFGGAYTY